LQARRRRAEVEQDLTEPAPSLADLKPKAKPPTSVSVLTQWINHAEKALGVPAAGGRMGWLVASTLDPFSTGDGPVELS
jgi:hypothetical protein